MPGPRIDPIGALLSTAKAQRHTAPGVTLGRETGRMEKRKGEVGWRGDDRMLSPAQKPHRILILIPGKVGRRVDLLRVTNHESGDE